MADEHEDRTEAPTQRKLDDARQEGRIPRSQDLAAAIGILASLLLLKAMGQGMLGELFNFTRLLETAADPSASDIGRWGLLAIRTAAMALLPFLLVLMALTIAGLAGQSGVVLSWKKLNPDLKRLNPISGFQRMFSKDALVKLGISLLKIGVLMAVAWYSLPGRLDQIVSLAGFATAGAWATATELIYRFALNLALVLLVLGVLDYVYQRFKLMQELRMTKQELKDELKRMEGDPLLKQRRRQIAQKLAMQRIAQEVPKADVIVTNPTEYAVALKYDPKSMAAPRVLAKGTDFLALRIRQIAQQHRVPIVQRPPLARALFAAVEVGDEVPPTYYRAVAEVLAYVYRLSGKVAAIADS
jgi:flagellar biosynthetic protein FlhB